MPAASSRRIRRTPEQARLQILEAAESCMNMDGPAGLRLARVAALAGVSHPTLLHHFGSREGLIVALYQHSLACLHLELAEAMRDAGRSSDAAMRLVFRAYRDGLARRLVWLLQAAREEAAEAGGLPMFEEIVRGVHEERLRMKQEPAPPLEDTRRIVHLMAIAAFGDALIGRRLRAAPDEAAEETQRDGFERWFTALLDRHVGNYPAR